MIGKHWFFMISLLNPNSINSSSEINLDYQHLYNLFICEIVNFDANNSSLWEYLSVETRVFAGGLAIAYVFFLLTIF